MKGSKAVRMVKEKKIFSEIDAYITGDMEEGLFVFCGKPVQGISMRMAEEAIDEEIEIIKKQLQRYKPVKLFKKNYDDLDS